MRQRISPEILERLDGLSKRLEGLLAVLVGTSAVAVFGVAAAMILSLGGEDRLTRFLIAMAAMLALGFLDSRYRWLARRRYLLSMEANGRDTYLTHMIGTSALLLGAGVVLVALALLLP